MNQKYIEYAIIVHHLNCFQKGGRPGGKGTYGGSTLRGQTENVSIHVGRTRVGGVGTAVGQCGYVGAGDDGRIGAACHLHCCEHRVLLTLGEAPRLRTATPDRV